MRRRECCVPQHPNSTFLQELLPLDLDTLYFSKSFLVPILHPNPPTQSSIFQSRHFTAGYSWRRVCMSVSVWTQGCRLFNAAHSERPRLQRTRQPWILPRQSRRHVRTPARRRSAQKRRNSTGELPALDTVASFQNNDCPGNIPPLNFSVSEKSGTCAWWRLRVSERLL